MAIAVSELHARLTAAINDTTDEGRRAHDELYAPDAIFLSYPPGFSLPVRAISNFRLDVLHESVTENSVFAESVLSGTYRPTDGITWLQGREGQRFEARVCTVTTFNLQGLVSRRAIYWDEQTLRQQLAGLQVVPAAPPKISFELNADEAALLKEFAAGGGAEYAYR